MKKQLISNDDDASIESIEGEMLENKNKLLKEAGEFGALQATLLYKNLSELEGREILPGTIEAEIKPHNFYAAIDMGIGKSGALIQPSHMQRPFSLIKRYPDTKELILNIYSKDTLKRFGLDETTDAWNEVRANEILREFSSHNTERAFNGDLIYWHAWLSAICYDFLSPLTVNHIKLFAIQHIEGLPTEIDKKLVEQRYKQFLGPHRISTVKRRIASLSVALELDKLPNPTKDKEFRRIIEKLMKKYGENRRKGRAITRDVLFAILDTCREELKDYRDRALILFGWASGGRRRSEISDAEVKNLESVGDDFVYHLVKSKTDQTGKGKTLPINGMAAQAIKEWIDKSGITDGKLFRSISKGGKLGDSITPVDINRIVKRRCQKAGYDPNLYSAHSLRSGFITEAGRRGCPLGDVMDLSNHKSVSVAMRYYQAGSVTNNSASRLI